MQEDNLICPQCYGSLASVVEGFRCESCETLFEVIRGIPKFVAGLDPFYEGKFAATVSNGKSWFDHARHRILRRLRFLQQGLSKLGRSRNLKILDIACGGGYEILSRFGEVTGVDISMQSLEKAKHHYPHVVLADASKLPFQAESFDVVVAMDFFGHVPARQKTAILREMHRVLKKNGVTLQYVETLGDNSMQRLAKRHPELYERYFVEQEGHVGLEPPQMVLERFYSAGLIPVRSVGAYKTWIKQPREIASRFGGEYSELYPWLHMPVAVDRAISKFRAVRLLGTATSELASTVVDKVLPLSMADGLFLEAVRK